MVEDGIAAPFGADASFGEREPDMLPLPCPKIANQCALLRCRNFSKAIILEEPVHEIAAGANVALLKFLNERLVVFQKIQCVGYASAICRTRQTSNRVVEFGFEADHKIAMSRHRLVVDNQRRA